MKKLLALLSSLLLAACSTTTQIVNDHFERSVENKGFISNYFELKAKDSTTIARMHYWDNQNVGKPVLLLIHGVGGDGISNWQNAMVNLSEDYHIFVPDILWYGQSTSHLPATLDSQVEAMSRFIEVLAPNQKINVVGHSYGGFIVYGLLAKTDLIDKATIISSPGGSFDAANLQSMLESFGASKPSELFVPKNDEEFKRLVNASSYRKIHLPAKTLDGIYSHYFSGNAEQKSIMLDYLIQARGELLTLVTKKQEAGELPPIQLIWGEDDQIFPLESGMRLSKALNAPLYIVTESAHNILLEKPAIVNRLIDSFNSNE